jgi:hypothetical protein
MKTRVSGYVWFLSRYLAVSYRLCVPFSVTSTTVFEQTVHLALSKQTGPDEQYVAGDILFHQARE